MGNALLRMRDAHTGMDAVELNNQTGEPRVGPDRMVQRHMAMVRSSKVEFSPASWGTGRVMFTPAEMRHNFAIWGLNNNEALRPQRHLYCCVRCKQAFSVEDRSGCVTPLDSHGNPLRGTEAIKRLDTFSCGPCPAFSGLARPRLKAKIIPIQSASGRLADLTSAGRRVWKAIVARWHRLPMTYRTTRNLRNKHK
jgi:hypothetical protein